MSDWNYWSGFTRWKRKRVWFPRESSVSDTKIPAFTFCWYSSYGELPSRHAELPITHRCYLTDEEYTFHILAGDIKPRSKEIC